MFSQITSGYNVMFISVMMDLDERALLDFDLKE